ncbi:MAG TPA: tetratricopeptide repeat protein, partial [Longimicrobiales bacterium]|nr:tetratricopeptide repeat protein [Longimicrobiales bacterium]
MAESNREEIAKLEALYANNPGGRVFTHLAEAYRKAGELDRARRILEDGIGRHADSASAHVVLGRVLQDQGAVVDAANAFQRVLELDPENRVALRSLGDLSRSAGQRDEALGYYRQLQSLDPGDDDLAITIHRMQTEPRAEHAEAEAAAAEVPQETAAGPEAREPAAAGFAGDGGRGHEPAASSGGEAHFVEAEA